MQPLRLNLWAEDDDEVGFQLAPMIDVVFNLLIFFVVISLFSRLEAEMSVQVPTAQEGIISGRSQGEIIINVLQDGSIRVNQVPMVKERLVEVLRPISQTYRGGVVIIRGDRAANWDAIMQVIDACAQADIWNISFATMPTNTETETQTY